MMEALLLFGWLGGFLVTSEAEAGMNPALDFRAGFFQDRQLERNVSFCKQDWFQNLRAAI